MKKGIYFSFDALIASTIFILTIISFLSYWNSLKETTLAQDSALSEEARRISNMLFLYSDGGFGFALNQSDRALNLTKIADFKNKQNLDLKKELSTGYNTYFVFELYALGPDGPQYVQDPQYNFGNAIPLAPNSPKTISKMVRIVPAYDGGNDYLAVISIYVYN